MKFLLVLTLFTFNTIMMAQKPNMQVWTDAWHQADAETFKNIYAKNALIFPPNNAVLSGISTEI